MDIRTLLCASILYSHNCQMIAWNAAGTDCEQIRSRATNLLYDINDSLRYGRDTHFCKVKECYPTYEEVLEVLSESEKDFLNIEDSKEFHCLKKVDVALYTMAKDIHDCLSELKEEYELFELEHKFDQLMAKLGRICDFHTCDEEHEDEDDEEHHGHHHDDDNEEEHEDDDDDEESDDLSNIDSDEEDDDDFDVDPKDDDTFGIQEPIEEE